MKLRKSRGVSTVEFAFSLMVLVPLVLGTGAIGINMIRTLQTIQLARDAGHMYGRGVDLSDPGVQGILKTLGTNLGLSTTPGAGKAIIILSALTYVDANTCAAGGAADAGGNPTSACSNLNKWVFAQRVVIGDTDLRTSNFGSPLTSGPNGVTLDSSGRISIAQYVTKTGAVANFSSANGINPYRVVDNQVSGLPSGQRLYLAEAAAWGFGMPPFVSGSPTYSYAFF